MAWALVFPPVLYFTLALIQAAKWCVYAMPRSVVRL